MSETTLRHIEHFTNTIGPRGSATPKEAEAHDYCQSTLEGLDQRVSSCSHRASRSCMLVVEHALRAMEKFLAE